MFKMKNLSKEDMLKAVRIDKIPNDVKSSIPIDSFYKNGVFKSANGAFTKQYRMSDANFNIASIDRQESMFSSYEEFLNTFTEEMPFSITIFNHSIDKASAMEKIKLEPLNDGMNAYRRELNQIYANKMMAGTKNISQEKFLTLSANTNSVDEAMKKFDDIDMVIKKTLRNITRTPLKPLDCEQRMEVFYNIYNPYSRFRFLNRRRGERLEFSLDALENNLLSPKDAIGPDSLEFKRNFAIIGEDAYAQSFYLISVPELLTSEFLSDVTSLPCEMIVNQKFDPKDPAETARLVKNQLTAINAQIADINKKNVEEGFGNILPPDLERAQLKAEELLDALQSGNQKLLSMTMTFVIFGRSFEEMKSNVEKFKLVCSKHYVPVRLAVYQQEMAFNTALPLGLNQIYAERLYTTESAAVFLPYTSQELMQENALYYGVNIETKNLVLYNRLSGKNYNGLVFGYSGSGKSFSSKLEMTSVLLKHPNAEVFVIDPENEYGDLATALHGQKINIGAGSTHHINPLDMDMAYAQEDDDGVMIDPIPMKTQYIVSLIQTMAHARNGLDPQSLPVLDRCIRRMYAPYIKHMQDNKLPLGITCDTQQSPTLTTLYNLLKKQPEPAAAHLAAILETYANGSFNTFSNKTNVVIDSKFVVYNINGLGPGLKELGLQICLNDCWNRCISNSRKGIYTWFYVDEFYLLLQNHDTAVFLMEIWKRARKWLGVPTGIMQNTEDLLATKEGRAILSNSSYIMILAMPYQDKQNLQQMLNLTDDQLDYISEPDSMEDEDDPDKSRTGLLYNNRIALPILLDFPEDTMLFQLMNTTHSKKRTA